MKKPKLHMGDTGLAAALLGLDAAALYEDRETYGQLLETFVLGELHRLASGQRPGPAAAGELPRSDPERTRPQQPARERNGA